MIGTLRGKVLFKNVTNLIMEVNGVGYEVQMPLGEINSLQLGEEKLIYTHLYVREDSSLLYGFLDVVTRNLFRELIKVSGIGAKMALSILTVMDPIELLQSVALENLVNLSRINGIGLKTAKRLVVELKDRLDKFEVPLSTQDTNMSDALSALISLGYSSSSAHKMLEPLKGQNLSSEVLIKKALQGVKGG